MLLGNDAPAEESPALKTPSAPLLPGAPRYENGDLFHGPLFRGLREIDACEADSFSAVSDAAPAPREWYGDPLRGTWAMDPLVLDVAFQAMIVWCIEQHGVPSLPSRINEYRQFRRFPKGGVKIITHVTRHSKRKAVADIEFIDLESGALVARMRGYECTLLASLRDAFAMNTLAQETAR